VSRSCWPRGARPGDRSRQSPRRCLAPSPVRSQTRLNHWREHRIVRAVRTPRSASTAAASSATSSARWASRCRARSGPSTARAWRSAPGSRASGTSSSSPPRRPVRPPTSGSSSAATGSSTRRAPAAPCGSSACLPSTGRVAFWARGASSPPRRMTPSAPLSGGRRGRRRGLAWRSRVSSGSQGLRIGWKPWRSRCGRGGWAAGLRRRQHVAHPS